MRFLFVLLLFFIAINAALADKLPNHGKHYRFEVEVEVPAFASAGRSLRLWIPYPVDNHAQRVTHFAYHGPMSWRITTEPVFNNRMVFIAGTTGTETSTHRFQFEVTRYPDYGRPNAQIPPREQAEIALFLRPSRLVPQHKRITKIALREGRGETAANQLIRIYYDYVVQSMRYDKRGHGWGNGDAIWACDNKRGNCTDFHSLYIAMARSQGIAARFNIGFPIPQTQQREGVVKGYHCWADAYDPQWGWRPIDASEAKKSGKREHYFAVVPADRIQFSMGRDIVLNPAQRASKLNYFVYPYIEVDGKPIANYRRRFSYKVLNKPRAL